MSNNSANDRRMISNPAQDIQLSNNIFSGWREFQAAMKMAETLSGSTIVPKDYQNNPGNCLIALEMAIRLGVSPMMTMQNLYVVNGRPAWSSQYIVAMINNSHKYKTELQYHMEGQGDNLRCYACKSRRVVFQEWFQVADYAGSDDPVPRRLFLWTSELPGYDYGDLFRRRSPGHGILRQLRKPCRKTCR